MDETAKQRREPVRRGPSARDLSFVTAAGGRIRRHKYLHELQVFSLPVLVAILMQAGIYLLATFRDGWSDWGSLALVLGALAMVPAFSATVLTAFRRHDALIVSSAVVTVALFSMAVSLLSAARIPLSYAGLALCLPAVVIVMAYANLAFHRAAKSRVALARFPRADAVAALLGGKVPILSDPDADLSDLDALLIDPAEHHSEQWSALLARCYLGGVEIMPWTRYLEIRQGRLDVESFDISHIAYTPSQLLYARVKRVFDVAGVLLTLPVTLLLALGVAAYIVLRDGGPVIFVQLRRGYGGRRFRMYKFRTMYKGTGGGATGVADDRIIPGCRLIRKLRLDELPQLYNILRGDMTLIGPRPEAVDLARWYEREIPKYTARLLVLPGITGWAQVSSGYTSNPAEALVKLSYDLYYIKHLSVDLDLLILFKTARTVLFGVGAR